MSFKTREKKRRRKIATANARAHQRENYADRHYLTVVSRSACCNECGRSLREGAECVYRYEPREILCKPCADAKGLRYRLAQKWERKNGKRKHGKLVPTPVGRVTARTAGLADRRAAGPTPTRESQRSNS